MGSNERKLIDDHKKVVETIRKYSNIYLINTAGDPPDEYDIEYKVKGYSLTTDGRIVVSKHHRIKIKIPFGYPHFPPTIKPLSPIFHPEVDDYVVPIANYWEEKKSLPALVLHIGNMICGVTYDIDSAFNKKAAVFYQKHKKDLPLDSLKPVQQKQKLERNRRDPISFSFLVPIFKTIFGLCFLAALGYGGLYFYEKLRLQQAGAVFTKAEIYEVDREFEKAKETAENALKSLKRYYLLKEPPKVLEKEIKAFLKSESLLQGLQGNIKYGDSYVSIESVQKIDFFNDLISEAEIFAKNEDFVQAMATYEKALEYAETNSLPIDTEETTKIHTNLQFDLFLSTATKAHDEEQWETAIENYQSALGLINEKGKYLGSKAEQKGKLRRNLFLDQISSHTKNAEEAEKIKDFATALEEHKAMVYLIGKNDAAEDGEMKETLVNSMQQVAVLEEKLRIQNNLQWLLDNYKEIFLTHYPATIPSSLRSPQATFLKYNDANPVFDLSCQEKGKNSVVKLRVLYQYNPETEKWSIYEGDV